MGARQRPDALDLRILELLARGYDDARVAYRVGLSHRSVQRRVQWLMSYLGANGRVALGARAHATGLLKVALGPEVKSRLSRPEGPTRDPSRDPSGDRRPSPAGPGCRHHT
jgi:DNA-binding CsgD family transcriptional regulator